jgi:hypothetical protein
MRHSRTIVGVTVMAMSRMGLMVILIVVMMPVVVVVRVRMRVGGTHPHNIPYGRAGLPFQARLRAVTGPFSEPKSTRKPRQGRLLRR